VQIQVNTDDNIAGRETLAARVQEDVRQGLSRFADQVTRIEVHLSDENAAKPGDSDKRCLMEARPAGQKPVAVTHMAATLPGGLGRRHTEAARAAGHAAGQAAREEGRGIHPGQ
jgi:hypothetical protein